MYARRRSLGQTPPAPTYGNPPPPCAPPLQAVYDPRTKQWSCVDAAAQSKCPSGYAKQVSVDAAGMQHADCVPTQVTQVEQQVSQGVTTGGAVALEHWPLVSGGLALVAVLAAGRGYTKTAIAAGVAAAGVAGVGSGVIAVPAYVG